MTKEDILNTLKAVKYPPYSKDIVSFGMVKYVKAEADRAEVRIFTGGEAEAAKKVALEATKTLEAAYPNFKFDVILLAEDPAKSAPPAPQSRAAQYAATGVMTNREKYNLKVSAPKPATRLQVVETKQTDWKPLYIASAAVTLCALAAAAWLLFPASAGDSAQQSRTPSELPTLGLSENSAKSDTAATESQKPKSAMTLSQTMEIVRGKIAEDRYGEALKFWDESPKAAGEPSLRRDILEDIGTRADVLMRQAENLLALESPSKPDIEKARKNLEKAARALDIAGMGRIEARTAKLKTLNDRISTK